MTGDSPTTVPPSSDSVDVQKRGVGVRLIAETGATIGGDPETIRLLETYSPMFILFPEVPPAGDGAFEPPHRPDAEHDYHPRPVELFLGSSTARSFYATVSDILSLIARLLGAYALIAGPAIVLLWATGLRATGLAASVLIAVAGAAGGEIWLRYRAAPAIGPARGRRTRDLARPRLGITGLFLMRDPRDRAWDAYRERLRADDVPSRTSYARIHETADGELYLQYWQFYVFNDWENWHEADWEVVMVRLGPDRSGRRAPLGAAYSSHLGGLWRAWSDVGLAHADGSLGDPSSEQEPATHPIVWVALGSHAQYFESIDGRHKAKLTQRWGFAQYGGWLSISSDATDRVPAEVSPSEPDRYRLRVLPIDDRSPSSEADEWWWLRFAGFWGAHEGIKGPVMQGTKWADPPRWVEEQCVGDPGMWTRPVVP